MLSGNSAGFLCDCTFFSPVYCHTRMRQLLPGTVSVMRQESEVPRTHTWECQASQVKMFSRAFPEVSPGPCYLHDHYPNSITGLFPDQSLGGSKRELGGACGSSVLLPYSELSSLVKPEFQSQAISSPKTTLDARMF